MLTLPIEERWFRMILRGEKKEEYREIKDYWKTRFHKAGLCMESGIPKAPAEVLFVNGYGNARPAIRATVRLSIGTGRPEWGAEPGEVYFKLIILKMEVMR